MAHAFADALRDVQPVGNEIEIPYHVVYYGPDLSAPDANEVRFTIAPGDKPKAIHDKLVQAIIDHGRSLGYDIVLERVVGPAYERDERSFSHQSLHVRDEAGCGIPISRLI